MEIILRHKFLITYIMIAVGIYVWYAHESWLFYTYWFLVFFTKIYMNVYHGSNCACKSCNNYEQKSGKK